MIRFTKNILIQALGQSPLATLIVAAKKPGSPVVFMNVAAEALLERSSDEIVGASYAELLMDGELPGPLPEQGSEVQQLRRSDDQSLFLRVQMTPLLGNDGQPDFLMVSVVANESEAECRDGAGQDTATLQNELVDARREIQSLQRTDPVTGLARRSAFEETLNRDWSIARREQNRIGVIVFEVDCLDEYRKIFGRHATDSLLRKVGHAIGGTLRRAGDLAARIENNRFAALIGNADETQALSCADRIITKVRNLSIHHPRSKKAKFVTVSFGVASEVPAWEKQAGNLLELAEQRLGDGAAASADRPVPKVLKKVVETVTEE